MTCEAISILSRSQAAGTQPVCLRGMEVITSALATLSVCRPILLIKHLKYIYMYIKCNNYDIN